MALSGWHKVLMAIIIIIAAWLALRYRQSNYEPPESTVTVTPPPPIVQPAPSADQPAAIEPREDRPAPLPPVPMAAPAEFPTPAMEGADEGIGGIGSFNTIAGETMFDFDPTPPPRMAEAVPQPPMEMEQAPPAPQPPMEQAQAPPAPQPPMEQAQAPPAESSGVEMYSRSMYAEL